jgi:methyl-accepting chemotaxis protein
VTQQNAALVEEAAAAAESMQEQAQSLAQSVSVFRLAANEQAAAVRRAPPRAANVERLPAHVARPAAANAGKAAPRSKTGTDDEWSEF